LVGEVGDGRGCDEAREQRLKRRARRRERRGGRVAACGGPLGTMAPVGAGSLRLLLRREALCMQALVLARGLLLRRTHRRRHVLRVHLLRLDELLHACVRRRSHQRTSEVIRGPQTPSEGHSEVIRGNSEVIRGHQRSSEVIRGPFRGHQRSSEVIRGTHRSSSHLHARLRASDVALELSNRLLRARELGRHSGGGAQSPLELADLDAARLQLRLRLLERLLGGQPACEKRTSSQSGAISVSSRRGRARNQGPSV